jgi:uncharacterized protein YycO
MDKLIVGFSTSKKFKILPWLIRKVEGTKFSHVYIKWYSAYFNRWIIYQAEVGGVQFMSSEMFDKDNVTLAEFEFPMSEEQNQRIVQFAMDHCGVPYGYTSILGFLLQKFNIKVPILFDNTKSYICSELAATILKEEFQEIDIDPNLITPRILYNYLNAKRLIQLLQIT